MRHYDSQDDKISIVKPQQRYTKDNSLYKCSNEHEEEKPNQQTNLLECEGFKDKKEQINYSCQQHQTWVNQRDKIALQYFKEQNKKLQEGLKNTKIFINMVIHDLRSPSLQINFSYDLTHQNLATMYEWTHEQHDQLRNQLKKTHQHISDYISQLYTILKQKDQQIEQQTKIIEIFKSNALNLSQELKMCKTKQVEERNKYEKLKKDYQVLLQRFQGEKSQCNQLNERDNQINKNRDSIQQYIDSLKQSKLIESKQLECQKLDLDQSLDFMREKTRHIFTESPNGRLVCLDQQIDDSENSCSSVTEIVEQHEILRDAIVFSSDVISASQSQIQSQSIGSIEQIQRLEEQVDNLIRQTQQITIENQASVVNNNYESSDATQIVEQAQSQLRILSQQINKHREIQEIWDNNFLESQEILQNCKHNSMMMNTLLDDLLDLAKQEQLTFQLNTSYFDLIDAVKGAFNNLQFLASQKEVTLQLIITKEDKTVFENIFGDEKRYEQILMNLISNALKFSKKKSTVKIEINKRKLINIANNYDQLTKQEKQKFKKINDQLMQQKQKMAIDDIYQNSCQDPSQNLEKQKQLEDAEDSQQDYKDIYFLDFEIKIIDAGQGISQDGLKKLFMNFQSLKEHKDINRSGTGLGLSICKQLISKMDGSISVNSVVGQGTTFHIEMATICQFETQSQNQNVKETKCLKFGYQNQKESLISQLPNQTQKDTKMSPQINKKAQQIIKNKKNSSKFMGNANFGENKEDFVEVSSFEESSDSNSVSSYDLSFQSEKQKKLEQQKQSQIFANIQGIDDQTCKQSEFTANFQNCDQSIQQLSQRNNQEIENGGNEKERIEYLMPPLFKRLSYDKRSQSLRPSISSKNQSEESLQKIQEARRYTINNCKNTNHFHYRSSNKVCSLLSFKNQPSFQNKNVSLNQSKPDLQTIPTLSNQAWQNSLQIIQEDNSGDSHNDQINSNSSKNQNQIQNNKLDDNKQLSFTSQIQNVQNNSENILQELNILIVNDEQFQLQILEQQFKDILGFMPQNVSTAQSGHEAIEMATKKSYDLVIMDLQMPILNGFQTSEQLMLQHNMNNSSQNTHPAPYIVLVTAGLVTQSLIESCKASYIQDQFSAPLQAHHIKEHIIPKLIQFRQQKENTTNEIQTDLENATNQADQSNELHNLSFNKQISLEIDDNPTGPIRRLSSTKTDIPLQNQPEVHLVEIGANCASGNTQSLPFVPQLSKSNSSPSKLLNSKPITGTSNSPNHLQIPESQNSHSVKFQSQKNAIQQMKRPSILNTIDFNMIPQESCESSSSSSQRSNHQQNFKNKITIKF